MSIHCVPGFLAQGLTHHSVFPESSPQALCPLVHALTHSVRSAETDRGKSQAYIQDLLFSFQIPYLCRKKRKKVSSLLVFKTAGFPYLQSIIQVTLLFLFFMVNLTSPLYMGFFSYLLNITFLSSFCQLPEFSYETSYVSIISSLLMSFFLLRFPGQTLITCLLQVMMTCSCREETTIFFLEDLLFSDVPDMHFVFK